MATYRRIRASHVHTIWWQAHVTCCITRPHMMVGAYSSLYDAIATILPVSQLQLLMQASQSFERWAARYCVLTFVSECDMRHVTWTQLFRTCKEKANFDESFIQQTSIIFDCVNCNCARSMFSSFVIMNFKNFIYLLLPFHAVLISGIN